MCLHDEMVRVQVFVSGIHVWHIRGFLQWHINLALVRTDVFFKSSFGWQTKALIIHERHDCAA